VAHSAAEPGSHTRVVTKWQDERTGEEHEEISGFRLASVFDISQTDGKPVPEYRLFLGTTSEAGVRLLAALRSIIRIPVIEEDTLPALGYFDPQANRIALHHGLEPDDRVCTLLHEYVHSLLHHGDAKPVAVSEKEAVAEGVSFVVSKHFGLDTSRISFDYVAGWAGSVDLVWRAGGEIQRTARRIIAELERVLLPVQVGGIEEAELLMEW
jgi:hypothetical protein